jgi:hypothetical protein
MRVIYLLSITMAFTGWSITGEGPWTDAIVTFLYRLAAWLASYRSEELIRCSEGEPQTSYGSSVIGSN